LTLPVTAKKIIIETGKDKELRELALRTEKQNISINLSVQTEFNLQNDVIMRSHRAVIPKNLRKC